jgi:hypothetical protein
LHYLLYTPEDGGNMFLRNITKLLPDYMGSPWKIVFMPDGHMVQLGRHEIPNFSTEISGMSLLECQEGNERITLRGISVRQDVRMRD